MQRRNFLKAVGSAATIGMAAGAGRGVSIVADPADTVAGAPPAQWAAKELQDALSAAGVAVRKVDRVAQAAAGDFCILAQGSKKSGGVPEALALSPSTVAGHPALLASGDDTRGLVYALLEVTDRFDMRPIRWLRW